MHLTLTLTHMPQRRRVRFFCGIRECHSCCTSSTFPTWYAPARCLTPADTLAVAEVHLSDLQTPEELTTVNKGDSVV